MRRVTHGEGVASLQQTLMHNTLGGRQAHFHSRTLLPLKISKSVKTKSEVPGAFHTTLVISDGMNPVAPQRNQSHPDQFKTQTRMFGAMKRKTWFPHTDHWIYYHDSLKLPKHFSHTEQVGSALLSWTRQSNKKICLRCFLPVAAEHNSGLRNHKSRRQIKVCNCCSREWLILHEFIVMITRPWWIVLGAREVRNFTFIPAQAPWL